MPRLYHRTSKPASPAESAIDWTHPLASGLTGLWLFNEGAGAPSSLLGGSLAGRTGGAWVASRRGPALAHTATTDRTTLASDPSALIGTSGVTITLLYRKRDATNRESGAFGVDLDSLGGAEGLPYRCGAHLPYSDGVVYWDVGGTSAANRLSVAGLTFGDDVWTFSSGPRGMEIWQNGQRRAANASSPTWTPIARPFRLGMHGGSTSGLIGGDLADYAFFAIHNVQLAADAIREFHAEPFALLQPTRRRFWSLPAIFSRRSPINARAGGRRAA